MGPATEALSGTPHVADTSTETEASPRATFDTAAHGAAGNLSDRPPHVSAGPCRRRGPARSGRRGGRETGCREDSDEDHLLYPLPDRSIPAGGVQAIRGKLGAHH